MDSGTHLEIERKYDVAEEVPIPSLAGRAGIAEVADTQTLALDAVYYDTAASALASARIALRRRTGGADEGWHIKRALGHGRLEQQWPLGEDGEGVPGAVAAALAEVADGSELRPVARVANRRVLARLLDEQGHPLAEFCDDHVRSTDLRDGTERSWREWEVELLDGAPADEDGAARLLDGIERIILEAGARPSASSSKLARALGVER